MAALSHLLVATLPIEEALARTLATGARLLPDVRTLRVMAPVGAAPGLMDIIATNPAHVGQAGRERHETMSTGQTSTLGYGDAVDEQVLVRHLPASPAGAECFPLLGSLGALLGVVIAERGGQQAHLTDSTRWRLVLDVLAVLLDRRERDLEATRLREQAAAEAQARDEFISLAAHELRSPLTSIKGYAQLLARQARKSVLPETMQRSVEAIEQQSVRMAEMIGEMLDASRIRRGVLDLLLAPTELQSLAARAIERRSTLFPESKFVLDAPDEPLMGLWDATRVEQVLRDLLDNAARHSLGGGPIVLTVRREGGYALISVRDQGIGIADDARGRIFDYLYRSQESEKRNLSGLGLGLYVSRHLVERMGGRLWLESTSTAVPSGSEFRFTLPLG